MRYLINLSYDGSYYFGYQIQDNKISVEGELEKKLSRILNEKVNTIGASRTDRGVHAYNQYCHFDTSKAINCKKLAYSLNSMLDGHIYIKKITKVNDEFHARYSVVSKEYLYKINIGEYNPIEKNYILQYNRSISRELLDQFVILMSGKHSFRGFTSDGDRNNYVRDLKIEYKVSNKILYLKFNSSGFFRYMIRNIVGLLLDINDGKKCLDDINLIFNNNNRCIGYQCASAVGLYLNKINYK